MASWRKGTTLALMWAFGFTLFVVTFGAVLSYLNDWEFEYARVTTWLPIALAAVFGVMFDVTYVVYNRKRHFAFIQGRHDAALARIRKEAKRRGVETGEESIVFKRVPWRFEPATLLRFQNGTVAVVEKASGVDVVVEGEGSAELKKLVDDALESR